MSTRITEPIISISSGRIALEGLLEVPNKAKGIVIFSHGSGSGRHSPRNQFVAEWLRSAGLATLLLDLLTPEEDRDYEKRFDIDLLTERLSDAVHFVRSYAATRSLQVGLFGASTGAASALRVAAVRPGDVLAVVSRGGRPDLTGDDLLPRVQAATLLIVGGRDYEVIEMNESAHGLLRCENKIVIVPGATHLFEEPGTLDEVAGLATNWFIHHLTKGETLSAKVST